jgi:hypothetical protein
MFAVCAKFVQRYGFSVNGGKNVPKSQKEDRKTISLLSASYGK